MMPVVYDELRPLARIHMVREAPAEVGGCSVRHTVSGGASYQWFRVFPTTGRLWDRHAGAEECFLRGDADRSQKEERVKCADQKGPYVSESGRNCFRGKSAGADSKVAQLFAEPQNR
jgi:hypothetical protein